MAQFIVLLYDNVNTLEQWEQVSPEEIQRIIGKYAEWSNGLAAAGQLVGGDKLRDGEGRVLRGASGSPAVTDGPFSETREVVGGYFILDVADYDEAVRVLSDCPHLELGGTMEIRAIEPTQQLADEPLPA